MKPSPFTLITNEHVVPSTTERPKPELTLHVNERFEQTRPVEDELDVLFDLLERYDLFDGIAELMKEENGHR